MTLAPGTQFWRRSRMRDVLVLLAGLVTVAAGATERQPRPAAPVFSFVNTAREAGLTAITVYGVKDTNKFLLETTGCGVAVLDIDNDGWLDLFIVNGSVLEGFPSGQVPMGHLYRNRRDGQIGHRPDRMGASGVQRRLRQRRRRRSVRHFVGTESSLPQPR